VTDPLGNTVSFTYDHEDNQTSITDANGNTTTYTYDPLGRLTTETNPMGQQTSYTYDAAGNLLSATDPCGNSTTFTYDANGRKISETNAAGETTTYGYDAVGNLIQVALPNGNTITRTYDALGRVLTETDSIGLFWTYAYDSAGRLVTTTDALGNATIFSYDANGRQVMVTDPMGNTISNTHDALGRVVQTTDREGNVVSHSYDALGRLISETDQLGNNTTFAYDNVGNRISTTDALGNTTSYEYDALGRLIRENYADGTIRQYAHDDVGNLVSQTNQNGQTTTYVYDSLNRRVQIDYPGTNDSAFTYNCAGRMLTANNQYVTISNSYDNMYRVTQTVQNGRTIDIAFNIPGRTTNITYPGGRVARLFFNPRGVVERVEDAASQVLLQYTYDGVGRAVSKTYFNGIDANFSYNANGWITTLDYNRSGTQLFGLEYDFDNQGNRLFVRKLHNTQASEAYQYDAKYRLIQFHRGVLDTNGNIPSPLTQIAYTLDALDNWTSKTSDGVTQNRAHNNMNELVSIDGVQLTYDDNGNLVDDGTNTYEYDFENRLIRVIRNSDNTVLGEYLYDAVGRRVQKSVAGTVTEYVYFNNQLIQEYANGSLSREYVTGTTTNNGVLFIGAAQHAYINDSLGNIIGITDSSGDIVEQYIYSPYGSVSIFDTSGTQMSDSLLENEQMFAMMRFDNESGLYHTLHRKYSPDHGRFTSHDPIRSLKRYAYAASNPINYFDPLGLWVQVPGEANVWMAEDGDSLKILASMAIQRADVNDWPCIWPVEMRDTNSYPAVKKCDKFDVSNLTAKSKNVVKVAVKATMFDLYTINTSSFFGMTRYNTSDQMYGAVAAGAGWGANPISMLLVGGHSWDTHSYITSKDWSVTFRGNDLVQYATNIGLPPDTNTYANASKKKGPLRCWFSRSAKVYGAGCRTTTWASEVAAKVLRIGASAYGTPETTVGLPGIWCIGFSCHITVNGALGDLKWRRYPGGL
jgi:RHS repeat-associated protein